MNATMILQCMHCKEISCRSCRGHRPSGYGPCPGCKHGSPLFRKLRYDVGDFVWCTCRIVSVEGRPPVLLAYTVQQKRVLSVGEKQIALVSPIGFDGVMFLDRCDVLMDEHEAKIRARELAERAGVPVHPSE